MIQKSFKLTTKQIIEYKAIFSEFERLYYEYNDIVHKRKIRALRASKINSTISDERILNSIHNFILSNNNYPKIQTIHAENVKFNFNCCMILNKYFNLPLEKLYDIHNQNIYVDLKLTIISNLLIIKLLNVKDIKYKNPCSPNNWDTEV